MNNITLILDLDNTLYSWMDSYAYALGSTIKYLSRALQKSVSDIRNSFKTTFLLHNSVEVVDAVRELDIWKSEMHNAEERVKIQNTAQQLFYDSFQDSLCLYDDVLDVLEWAKQRDITLIAFSDARAYWIDFRLKALALYSYFDQVYVLEDEPPTSCHDSHYPPNIIQYSLEHSKPKVDMLIEIMQRNNLCDEQVFVVGDSKRKDILPATKLGLHTLWARYGCQFSPSSRRLVGSVTPWTPSQRASGGAVKPQYTIDAFSKVVSIVEQYMEDQNV